MLKVATTEGRFRMVMPDLMAAFESGCRTANGEKNTVCCNDIHIQGFMGDAVELRKMLSSGDLDLAFSGLTPQMPADIESKGTCHNRGNMVYLPRASNPWKGI